MHVQECYNFYMKRILFIVNFTSGTAGIRNRLPQILETLSLRDCLVTVFPIVPAKGLVSSRILNTPYLDYDCILCAGGDGTLNYLVNEMMTNDIQLPLAYIPTGSTNDFSRSLNRGHNRTDVELARAAVSGNDFVYDIGKANGRYFNYIAAFGAFTEVSYETPQDLKNTFGYLAYVLSTLGSLADFGYRTHMLVEHDGIIEEGDYIFGAVSNSTSVGGVESPLLKDVRLDDGLMEVTLIKAPENFSEFSDTLGDLVAGTITHDSVRMFRTDHVRFTADKPAAWTLDGEAGPAEQVMEVQVVSRAITMKVPRSKL